MPAAAVTALRKLGLEADEGELAVLARTSPWGGTSDDMLCAALRRLYAANGLSCEYRRIETIEDLKRAGVAIVPVKHALLVDHCVAVLEVTDEQVVVADPIAGKRRLSHDEFRDIWRFCGIVLKLKADPDRASTDGAMLR